MSNPSSGSTGSYTVWSLALHYYQYGWEHSVCESRHASLEEAVKSARALMQTWAQTIARHATTLEEALQCAGELADLWIDGPGISNSERMSTKEKVFEPQAEFRAAIHAYFAEGSPAVSGPEG